VLVIGSSGGTRPEPDQRGSPAAAPRWSVREALDSRIAREQLLDPSALDTLAAAVDQPHLAMDRFDAPEFERLC